MSNKNSQLFNAIEAKLIQAESMVNIALDNHNYKNAGYDEPFIEHLNMGNLLWVISDLIENACGELGKLELKEDKSNA